MVDYTSAGIVIIAAARYSSSSDLVVLLFILYNVLAFGLQVFIGHATDRLAAPREVALIGGLLVVIAVATLTPLPLAAIILVGVGNACYHVGGGSIALNVTPKRAAGPGVFVAPGALGLFAGTLAARYGHFTALVPVALIALLVIAAYAIELPRMDYAKVAVRKQPRFWLVLFGLLVAIAVRSLVGLAIVLPWKSQMALAVVLVVSVFAGKAAGGVLADRFGWTKVAVGSLVIATPLLVLGPNLAAVAILGMFLFNFTMPVTLAALSNLLPGRPGLSFGLTCLALLAGALPILKGYTVFSGRWVILTASVIAIVAVYIGLTAGRRRAPGALAGALEPPPARLTSSGG